MGTRLSSSLISTLGVKMTRLVCIRRAATLSTSAADAARTPKRMVPSPGKATE